MDELKACVHNWYLIDEDWIACLNCSEQLDGSAITEYINKLENMVNQLVETSLSMMKMESIRRHDYEASQLICDIAEERGIANDLLGVACQP